jgi:carboxypeptidase Q
MRKISIIALIAIACFSISFKGDKNTKVDLAVMSQIKNEGLNHSKVMETLFELTDVNGPRLTGSTGMKNAERWAKAKLQSWGLENANIEQWGSFGKGWEINRCYVAMTAPYYQQLIAVPRAWTPGTPGITKANVVLVRIDSVEDLDKYVGRVRDHIVLLAPAKLETSPNFKPDASRVHDTDLQKMEDEGMPKPVAATDKPAVPTKPRVNLRRAIDSFMVAQGALAMISGGRGTMGTVFTSNGAPRAWDAKPVLPEVEMNFEHLARMVRLLKAGQDVQVEIDTKTTFLIADSIENNVVAEIPGSDLKDEYVMLGGHMDSWHAATGATDNGTGVAVCMEAVRILQTIGVKPRRTIRVLLWSGEEQGLLGSRGYVRNHFGNRITMDIKPEQGKVSAYYNLDNGGGKIRGIYLQNNEALRPLFSAWLKPFKEMGANTVTIRNTGSTDHISFDEIGIPGFQFIQDGLEYGTRTHHTNMDSYDRVVEEDLKQASVVMAAFVYNTAVMDEKIVRKPLPTVNPAADSWRR